MGRAEGAKNRPAGRGLEGRGCRHDQRVASMHRPPACATASSPKTRGLAGQAPRRRRPEDAPVRPGGSAARPAASASHAPSTATPSRAERGPFPRAFKLHGRVPHPRRHDGARHPLSATWRSRSLSVRAGSGPISHRPFEKPAQRPAPVPQRHGPKKERAGRGRRGSATTSGASATFSNAPPEPVPKLRHSRPAAAHIERRDRRSAPFSMARLAASVPRLA